MISHDLFYYELFYTFLFFFILYRLMMFWLQFITLLLFLICTIIDIIYIDNLSFQHFKIFCDSKFIVYYFLFPQHEFTIYESRIHNKPESFIRAQFNRQSIAWKAQSLDIFGFLANLLRFCSVKCLTAISNMVLRKFKDFFFWVSHSFSDIAMYKKWVLKRK